MGDISKIKVSGVEYDVKDETAREGVRQLSEDMANLQTSGLTTAQVNALDGLFKLAAYTEDASDAYAAFKTAFGLSDSEGGGETPDVPDEPDATTYTVTNNLTNVANSNSDTTATGFYRATLSVADGYNINVIVTMGGVDVTADVYTEDGTILITNVTGDIVITAVAVSSLVAAYILPEEVSWDGTDNTVYDTGYVMYPDGDRTVTWCIELTTNISAWSGFSMVTAGANYGLGMNMGNNQAWNVVAHNGSQQVHSISGDGQMVNKRIVATAKQGVTTYYAWILASDAVKKHEVAAYSNFPTATATTVKLGATASSLIGTVHDFRVYERTLTDAQIEAYLRGEEI